MSSLRKNVKASAQFPFTLFVIPFVFIVSEDLTSYGWPIMGVSRMVLFVGIIAKKQLKLHYFKIFILNS